MRLNKKVAALLVFNVVAAVVCFILGVWVDARWGATGGIFAVVSVLLLMLWIATLDNKTFD